MQNDTESIVEKAHAEGLTLQEYVNKDPDKAIKEAEKCLMEWLKIQSAAAIEGEIATERGSYRINKNTTKLIELRVDAAQKQVDLVNEYAYTAYTNGEKRREHLVRVLYNRAVHKGDTRALIYMIDRIDGRPGEDKKVDMDYDLALIPNWPRRR